jgi:hypothetical protein
MQLASGCYRREEQGLLPRPPTPPRALACPPEQHPPGRRGGRDGGRRFVAPADGAGGGEDDGPRVPPFAGPPIQLLHRHRASLAATAPSSCLSPPAAPAEPGAGARARGQARIGNASATSTPRFPLRQRRIPGDASPPPVQGARNRECGDILGRERVRG